MSAKPGCSWNIGLTKLSSRKLRKIGRKISITKRRRKHSSWNAGLTKKNDRRVRLIAKKFIGRRPWNKGLTHETDRRLVYGNTWNKGRTKETDVRLLRQSKKMTGRYTGRQSSGWRNGASREPYPLEFRRSLKEAIKNRDGRKCQGCGAPELESTLTVHHINYVKKDCRQRNLIALCSGCNSRANFGNRRKWKRYYRKIVRHNLERITTWN